MHIRFSKLLLACAAILLFSCVAAANPVPIGYVSYDATGLNVVQFDISNQTGPNSSPFPDPTWPVSTPVNLSSLSLLVHFQSGASTTYGSSYFTLSGDGLSFDGGAISTLDPAISGELTGMFSPLSILLNDGTSMTIAPTFDTLITDPTGGPLMDGDFGIIYASPGTLSVPEPATWLMMAAGLAGIWLLRRKPFGASRAVMMAVIGLVGAALFFVPVSASATAAVHLNSYTTPSSGTAGVSNVNITGSGFPTGTITPANVSISLATSCGGAGTPALAISVKPLIGTSDRIGFTVPSSLATGLYYISISGTTSTAMTFASSNCSAIQVTHSSSVLASCNPGSSLGIVAPNSGSGTVNVTAYVPNGAWALGSTGIRVVNIEGTTSAAAVATGSVVNSCAANSVTGIAACTANDANVYLLNGSSIINTLTSGSNSTTGFSGGSCANCGIAINAVTNQAVIQMGYSGSASGSAIQFLDLATGVFGTVVPANNHVSENMLWDPFRNLILSPSESNNYDLFKITGGGLPGPSSVAEFGNPQTQSGEFNSAGEDCTTGIALAPQEFTSNAFLADLTQATFGSTSWSAPSQSQTLPPGGLSAGASAVAVAPGSSHLGVVAGEFGGSALAVIQLPSTSGSGTPAIVDWAYANIPGFSNGYDPHTTTAYTSPNDGRAYAVLADWSTNAPARLAIVDLAKWLAAPRTAPNTMDPTYDLVANGVVRFVPTF